MSAEKIFRDMQVNKYEFINLVCALHPDLKQGSNALTNSIVAQVKRVFYACGFSQSKGTHALASFTNFSQSRPVKNMWCGFTWSPKGKEQLLNQSKFVHVCRRL
jgi:hypothetical protein